MQLASYLGCEKMVEKVDVSARAAAIEYAIRDVVVPAIKLESEGHEIIRLNVGDPLAFEGLPTPEHMIEAYKRALDSQDNGYGPSYGIPQLRQAIAAAETAKGWACSNEDVYVTHGVTEARQLIFAAVLEDGSKVLAPGPHYPPYMAYPQLYGAETIECPTIEMIPPLDISELHRVIDEIEETVIITFATGPLPMSIFDSKTIPCLLYTSDAADE